MEKPITHPSGSNQITELRRYQWPFDVATHSVHQVILNGADQNGGRVCKTWERKNTRVSHKDITHSCTMIAAFLSMSPCFSSSWQLLHSQTTHSPTGRYAGYSLEWYIPAFLPLLRYLWTHKGQRRKATKSHCRQCALSTMVFTKHRIEKKKTHQHVGSLWDSLKSPLLFRPQA